MPDARRPTCRQWAPRHTWQSVPPDSFPFVIRCPNCDATAKVGDIGYRMSVTPEQPPPASWAAGHGIPGQRPTRHR